MRTRQLFLLAAISAPIIFSIQNAQAQSTCPYEARHRQLQREWADLEAQRTSKGKDLEALCAIVPRIAENTLQLAQNQEAAARHSGCKVHNDGSSASQLRADARRYQDLAQECQRVLASTPQQSPQSGGTRPRSRQSASCSDITGTGGGSPAATNCKKAQTAANTARQMAKGSPRRAVQIYKEAAEQYRLAGDFNAAAAMLAEFEKLAAAAASAPAPAASSSGRSVPVPAAGGASGLPPVPKMWRPTKEDADCESANATERATAGWYITCMEPELPKAPPRYKHPIDSQTLFLKAYDVCGSSSRDTHDCYVDAKVKYLLDNDPIIRSQCQDAGDGPGSSLRNEIATKLGKTIDQAERKKNAVIACVDNAYLYGPDGPPSVRDQLKVRLREQTSTSSDAKDAYQKRLNTSSAPAPHCPPGAGWAPHACCPAGSGMKPTPGAFGAWSCQPLGLALGTAPVQEGTTADVVEAFERRLDQVTEQAVAAADRQLASQMSPEAREECTAASFAAVRSVLKGGVPVVPEKCRGMADIARSQLAYYASTHIDAANSGVEELLAYLPRGQLGPPQPGVQDLQAGGRMVREAECMARGGTPEHCVAANEPLTDQAAGQSASGRSAPPRARFVRGGISP